MFLDLGWGILDTRRFSILQRLSLRARLYIASLMGFFSRFTTEGSFSINLLMCFQYLLCVHCCSVSSAVGDQIRAGSTETTQDASVWLTFSVHLAVNALETVTDSETGKS